MCSLVNTMIKNTEYPPDVNLTDVANQAQQPQQSQNAGVPLCPFNGTSLRLKISTVHPYAA